MSSSPCCCAPAGVIATAATAACSSNSIRQMVLTNTKSAKRQRTCLPYLQPHKLAALLSVSAGIGNNNSSSSMRLTGQLLSMLKDKNIRSIIATS